jgi:alcohol dehydrogenase
MRALVYDAFDGPLIVRDVPAPEVPVDGVVIELGACGLCRSDLHGWRGHDPSIRLPHVPGHELAGTVVAVGRGVREWTEGQRVTVPFVCACGRCAQCATGDHQVCSRQTQPGFTHWGALAQLVAIENADVNLVALPPSLSFAAAAGLGCRFATAFRAVLQQGQVRAGEWVAIHGCGGLGLSAVHIAAAAGANVVGVDVSPDALAMATRLGAKYLLDAREVLDVPSAIIERTEGGAHVSIDALGNSVTCHNSVACLRPRGRHVQVGLLPASTGGACVPMNRIIGLELEVLGSHGMAAHAYPDMLALVVSGQLRPELLVTRELGLDDAGAALRDLGSVAGISVVTSF